MKKFGIIVILLLVLTAGGIGAAHFVVGQLADDVTVTETVLAGDKTAAEGVAVTTKTEYREQSLHWETTHTIGKTNTTDCQFRMAKNGEYAQTSAHCSFGLGLHEDFVWEKEYGNHWNSTFQKLPFEMIQNVIDSISAVESCTKVVSLNDYVDYYPVEMYLETEYGDGCDYKGYTCLGADRYFQIPVPDEEQRKIYAKKDTAGNLEKLETESINFIDLTTSAIIHEDYAYIAISNMYYYPQLDEEFFIKPLTMPDRVYGIHRVPLTSEYDDASNGTADFTKAERILPLNPGQNVFEIVVSPDGKDLLLFSEENKKFYLLVFDLVSCELKQKLYLMDKDGIQTPNIDIYFTTYDSEVLVDGDYVVAKLGRADLCVVKKEKNTYQLKVADTLSLGKPVLNKFSAEYADVLCDGDKFYLACMSPKGGDDEAWCGASYYLLTFDGSELAYAGFYENSIDYAAEFADDGPTIKSAYRHPITLSLPGAP